MRRTSILNRPLLAILWLVSSMAPTGSFGADLVVVAGNQSRIGQLSREAVINIFMGGYRQLPDGSVARPIDQSLESSTRRMFYRRLVDKSPEEINAYWARLVFSGRTTPPATARTVTDLIGQLNTDPNALAYLDRQQLPHPDRNGGIPELKVVFVVPE